MLRETFVLRSPVGAAAAVGVDAAAAAGAAAAGPTMSIGTAAITATARPVMRFIREDMLLGVPGPAAAETGSAPRVRCLTVGTRGNRGGSGGADHTRDRRQVAPGGQDGAMKVAARAHVPPFAVMEIIAAANARRATGQHVLNLAAGEPAAGASEVVRRRAAELLGGGGGLGYTEALGMPALREAIATHYLDAYGVTLDPRHVAVATGSSGGFALAFLAAFDAGDRVALARPGYPAYRNILSALGCEVVELHTDPDAPFDRVSL
jgi:hypothetical protein